MTTEIRNLPMLLAVRAISRLWYGGARLSASIILAAALSAPGAAQAQTLYSYQVMLQTSDVRMDCLAGIHSPRLIGIKGRGDTPWRNLQAETLPANVEVGGVSTAVVWQFRRDLSNADAHHITLVYESLKPHLRLLWIWVARAGFGPLEHSIKVENLSGQDIWLPMLDSLRLNWAVSPVAPLENLYVEKGADTPSAQGTHLETIGDNYAWTGHSSPYALPLPGVPREIIPAEFVYRSGLSPSTSAPNTQAQNGWFAGLEFSGRIRIALERHGNRLSSTLGLNPDPGPFRMRVDAGNSFETPTAFLGAFNGGPDGAANQLRPWVRAVLGNPLIWKDPQYPLLVDNSWGSGMEVDEAVALRMIAQAKELGLEMFHLDAGWFRGVGDWYPDKKKFPNGLRVIADAAHKQGLRFGIWVDWTQAGVNTSPGALNAFDPTVRSWLISDVYPGWKPQEYKGRTIDIGVPAARAYASKELKRMVEDYRLDMLEHDGYLVAKGCIRSDHPHAPPDRSTMHIVHDWGSDFIFADNSTDVSYRAVQSYYSIYQQLRREHPGLLLEVCNDGGRMVDFGSAAHGDYFSITDTYDPLSNRRAFYDASYMLPSAMLESYVEKWPVPKMDNFLYMLRSGMMGWISIMQDTSAWTPEQHEAARQAFVLYKQKLRPLIRDAHIYHISQRPDGVHWDGMEYWDPGRRQGVVFAFRGSIADEPDHRFILAGLKNDERYRLHYQDGSMPDSIQRGSELMSNGLPLRLTAPLSSELVWIEGEAVR